MNANPLVIVLSIVLSIGLPAKLRFSPIGSSAIIRGNLSVPPSLHEFMMQLRTGAERRPSAWFIAEGM
jgi:hypothetical protein